jgi:hypothetical protein
MVSTSTTRLRSTTRARSARVRRTAATTAVGVALGLASALLPDAAHAQEAFDQDKQDDLDTAHSVLQKTGLVTLGLTGVTGGVLMLNKPTLFGDGRCKSGDPLLGEFGCGGLTILHAGFGATTLGLFVAQEIVAGEMPISPYDMGSEGRQDAMTTLRYVNIGLFAVQPVLGFVAANPGVIGIPEDSQEDVSRVLRTIHFGIGGTLATTYTVNAALQW